MRNYENDVYLINGLKFRFLKIHPATADCENQNEMGFSGLCTGLF